MSQTQITEASLFVAGRGERRKRGRPRVEPSEPVMTRLPLPLYDRIVKTANLRGESVSAVVRSLLTVRIKRELL